MTLLFLSFIAGVLTVLAPCVLPLLPVIIGGSATKEQRWRPYIITASLCVSLLVFTFALKFTTLFISVDPNFWKYFSGIILIFLGFIGLFPRVWDKINVYFKFSSTSDGLLSKANQKSGVIGAVLTGAALGPVFSSCSPTYAIALSTVLQGNLWEGLINMIAYIFGLSLVMLSISLLGQRLIKKLRWAANPEGWFRKIISVIFILVGVLIFSGYDKRVELFIAERTPFDPARFEQSLLNQSINLNSTKNLIPQNEAKKASELVGLQGWINSSPLTLEGLKGKVVLVDFWTYSCINCQRTLPYLNKYYETYGGSNFVILGIHTPEFAFERKEENVRKAVDEFNIKYPVALDNDYETWDAFENQFWPSKYLIDAEGRVRYVHYGEGEYAETEENIRALLGEAGVLVDNSKNSVDQIDTGLQASRRQTPETYFGWALNEKFGKQFANQAELKGFENKSNEYVLKTDLISNNWSLGGRWLIKNEEIIPEEEGKLLIKFSAKEVYLVAGAESDKLIQVKLNGLDIAQQGVQGQDVNSLSQVSIGEDRLYKLVKFDSFREDQVLELQVPVGVRLNVFTFGS